MYELALTKVFDRDYQSLVKGNKDIEKRILKTLEFLIKNPFYPSLKSHKVNTRNYGVKWSSRITGDLRLIWDFVNENEEPTIIVLTISQHSGSRREYQ